MTWSLNSRRPGWHHGRIRGDTGSGSGPRGARGSPWAWKGGRWSRSRRGSPPAALPHRRLPTPTTSLAVGTGYSLRHRGIALPSDAPILFSGVRSVPSRRCQWRWRWRRGSVDSVGWTREVSRFFSPQLFVSGTGAKLDTTDAASWPETSLRPSPATTNNS